MTPELKKKRVYDVLIHEDAVFPDEEHQQHTAVWRVSRATWRSNFVYSDPVNPGLHVCLVLKGEVGLWEKDFPYRVVQPGEVMVLGAGSGRHQHIPEGEADVLFMGCFQGRASRLARDLFGRLPQQIPLRHPARVEQQLRLLLEEAKEKGAKGSAMRARYAELILHELAREQQAARMSRRERDFEQLRVRAMEQLHRRPRLQDLCEHFNWSRPYVTGLFQEFAGDSPHRWLLRQQMIPAVERLREGMRVKEVAAEFHWPDAASFSKACKRVSGRSPREWREV